jgi:hypothetical protein
LEDVHNLRAIVIAASPALWSSQFLHVQTAMGAECHGNGRIA